MPDAPSTEFVSEQIVPHVDLEDRHPGVQDLMRFLVPNPNLPDRLRPIVGECHRLSILMVSQIPDGPELTAGLRKLLEAKDCFVRGAL